MDRSAWPSIVNGSKGAIGVKPPTVVLQCKCLGHYYLSGLVGWVGGGARDDLHWAHPGVQDHWDRRGGGSSFEAALWKWRLHDKCVYANACNVAQTNMCAMWMFLFSNVHYLGSPTNHPGLDKPCSGPACHTTPSFVPISFIISTCTSA